MKIAISADCTRITMRKKAWAMSCPAADLPKWIKTYTHLRDRKGGAYAAFYADDLADMIKAQAKLAERIAARAVSPSYQPAPAATP